MPFDDGAPFGAPSNAGMPPGMPPVPAGEHTRWVQSCLGRITGTPLPITGVMDAATRSALRSFQQSQGLPVDGIVGPPTQSALTAACAAGAGAAAAAPAASPAEEPAAAPAAEPASGAADAGAAQGGEPQSEFGFQTRSCHCPSCRAQREAEEFGWREIAQEVQAFEFPLPVGRRSRRQEGSCGVPPRSLQDVAELEFEIQKLQRRMRTQPVRPRLSLFQNASETAHRNHFQCQADRWAGRISAQASPTVSDCPRRVGGTPYDRGADIIAAIAAANRCQKQRLQAVHIFSHSGSDGIYGAAAGCGIYKNAVNAADRQNGARHITDIPTSPLADDAVVILHGCNTASGNDNFAQSLFEHLSKSLPNTRVFGHSNSGCAGRDNSWREYSKRSPKGQTRLSSLTPHYEGDGCCG
jgi:hypothetical protein